MKKLLLLWVLALVLSTVSAFQSGNETRKVDGKEYPVYKVQQGDTWYAIARKFAVSYAELRVANKGVDDKLVIGKELLIPSKLKPNDPYFQKNQLDKPETKAADKYHVVEPSQTLYSISKMYGVTVDHLKVWNQLSSNEISVGQKLLVSKPNAAITEPAKQVVVISAEPVIEPKPVETKAPVEKAEPVVENVKPVEEAESVKENVNQIDTSLVTSKVEEMESPSVETKIVEQSAPVVEKQTEDVVFSNGRQQMNETGNAAWIDEENANSEKYYALHRTAKVGTVIRVMNLSNSRKIYVKITGQISDSADTDGILIILSKASAEKLGITDKTARVNLLYGAGEE